MLIFSEEQKKDILHIIRILLSEEEKVVFGYIYGSFTEGGSVVSDIDIALYTKDITDIFSFQADMKIRLSELLQTKGYDISPDEIDIRVINNAPYDFVIEILDKGILVIDNNPALRTDYIERISLQYRMNEIILSEI